MMNNIEKAYYLIGVTMCVVAAILMANGHILDDATTGIARVLLITGICFFGSCRKTLGSLRKTQ
jgi:hypothetical protein